MTSAQIGMMLTMVIYLGGMIIVGAILAKQTNNVSDFYLGGRKLGPLVTAMSAEASDMSSYLLMGIPGLAYLTGLAEAGWTIIGLAVGTYLNWLFVAKRIRLYSERTGSITIPEFFSDRYHDHKKILSCISAIMIIIFFIPYTGSGFAACGKLFGSLFGVDYHLAMIVSAIVILLYTSLGGFLAASFTDFIQSIVMSLALLIVLLFGVSVAGGWEAVIDNASKLPGYLDLSKGYDPVSKSAGSYGMVTVISTLAWGLGYFGMPHILLRFMAIEDDSKLALSRRVASIWVVIAMAVATVIGLVGLGMTAKGAIPSLEGSGSETVIVEISKLLSRHGFVFSLVAGLILSGILASTMSTADSQLLAASSSVSRDLVSGFFKINLKDAALMNVSRISLISIGLIGIFIAWNPASSVFRIVSFAWAGFGASFGPLMLLALFWRRSNLQGAIAGLVSGGLMVFLWKYLIRPMGGVYDIYELLPAFLAAIIVNVVVSLATPAPDESITRIFDSVRKHSRT